MTDYYRDVIIETYFHSGGGSKHPIRAKPISGQGLSTSMTVECSSSMREKHAIGTLLKVRAKIKCTSQEPHLYTYYGWPYEVITAEDANDFIAKKIWRESITR